MSTQELQIGDDGIAALENVSECACLELPSGKRVWVFPDSEIDDAFAAFDDELRASLERSPLDPSAGRLLDFHDD